MSQEATIQPVPQPQTIRELELELQIWIERAQSLQDKASLLNFQSVECRQQINALQGKLKAAREDAAKGPADGDAEAAA